MKTVKTRSKRFEARNAEIAELWETGEYSLNVLAAMFGLGRNYINCILRSSGNTVSRKIHRNGQIIKKHKDGRSSEWLSERFNLSQNRVRQIIRSSKAKDVTTCSMCGAEFVPRTYKSRQCSPGCYNAAWEHDNAKHASICLVCGDNYTSHKKRETCSRHCAHMLDSYRKIERNIEIRKLDFEGIERKEIAQRYNLSPGQTHRICQKGSSQARVCVAVISLRRHEGRSWLSQGAQLERLRAERTLRGLGFWGLYKSSHGRHDK